MKTKRPVPAKIMGSELIHIVPDGKTSFCGQERTTVTYITGLDGFHCDPQGAGYDWTCQQCVMRATRASLSLPGRVFLVRHFNDHHLDRPKNKGRHKGPKE